MEVEWRRIGGEIKLSVSVPATVKGKIILPAGYVFGGEKPSLAGLAFTALKNGEFIVKKV